MALRSEDEKSSRRSDLFGFGSNFLFESVIVFAEYIAGTDHVFVIGVRASRRHSYKLIGDTVLTHLGLCHKFGVAAEHDIRTASRHVGRDRDGTVASRLSDYLSFAFVIFCIKDVVLYALLTKACRKILRFVYRDGTDEHGLTFFVTFFDLPYDRIIFTLDRFVYVVGVIEPYHRLIGRHFNNIKTVYRPEFLLFRQSRTGHARELFVHTEKVLEGYCSESAVFLLHFDVFLCLDSLMQTVRIPTSRHKASREGIDDNNSAVVDNIVLVKVHDTVGADSIVYIMCKLGILGFREVLDSEEALCLLCAARRKDNVMFFLVYDVVGVDVVVLGLLVKLLYDEFLQSAGKPVRLPVHIGRFLSLSRNDERSPRLINEYRVDLINDRKYMAALCHLLLVDHHIVTQVVKPELIVRAVGYICTVSRLLFFSRLSVKYKPGSQSEKFIYPSHLLAVSAGKVIVHGYYVNSPAGQRIKVGGHRGNKRLTFAGLHLGDPSLMKYYTSEELNVKGTFAENAVIGFPYRGKSLGKQRIKRFSCRVSLLEIIRNRAELVVRHIFESLSESLYLIRVFLYFFDLMVAVATENL